MEVLPSTQFVNFEIRQVDLASQSGQLTIVSNNSIPITEIVQSVLMRGVYEKRIEIF